VLLKHADLLEQLTAAQALMDVSNGARKTYYNNEGITHVTMQEARVAVSKVVEQSRGTWRPSLRVAQKMAERNLGVNVTHEWTWRCVQNGCRPVSPPGTRRNLWVADEVEQYLYKMVVTASRCQTAKRMTHALGRQPRRMGIQRWGKPKGSAGARFIHLWGHNPPGIMAMRHHFDKAVNFCLLRPVCEPCRASMLGPVILALWRFARCCGWLGLSQGHLRHASSACGGLTSSPWAPPTFVLTKRSTVCHLRWLRRPV
jgi:hypothetical protein